MSHRTILIARKYLRSSIIFICMMAAATWCLAHEESEVSHSGSPPVLFSELLPDVPGKRLTVVELDFKPGIMKRPSHPHRHPGSVYVYVTKGSVRWGIEGEEPRILHAGDSFFEPAGVLHTISENASTSEPAAVIAVMLVPDGAPLVLPE